MVNILKLLCIILNHVYFFKQIRLQTASFGVGRSDKDKCNWRGAVQKKPHPMGRNSDLWQLEGRNKPGLDPQTTRPHGCAPPEQSRLRGHVRREWEPHRCQQSRGHHRSTRVCARGDFGAEHLCQAWLQGPARSDSILLSAHRTPIATQLATNGKYNSVLVLFFNLIGKVIESKKKEQNQFHYF